MLAILIRLGLSADNKGKENCRKDFLLASRVQHWFLLLFEKCKITKQPRQEASGHLLAAMRKSQLTCYFLREHKVARRMHVLFGFLRPKTFLLSKTANRTRPTQRSARNVGGWRGSTNRQRGHSRKQVPSEKRLGSGSQVERHQYEASAKLESQMRLPLTRRLSNGLLLK